MLICAFKEIPQGLGYTNIHFHWTCLDLETKISERALGKNEMTGMTGRPRKIPQGYKYSFSLDVS